MEALEIRLLRDQLQQLAKLKSAMLGLVKLRASQQQIRVFRRIKAEILDQQ